MYNTNKKEGSNREINMKFFNEYLNRLREDIVDSLADGTSKLTLKNSELSEYYIEYIPISQQNKYVSDYLDRLDDKRKELDNMKVIVDEAMDKIIQNKETIE